MACLNVPYGLTKHVLLDEAYDSYTCIENNLNFRNDVV